MILHDGQSIDIYVSGQSHFIVIIIVSNIATLLDMYVCTIGWVKRTKGPSSVFCFLPQLIILNLYTDNN